MTWTELRAVLEDRGLIKGGRFWREGSVTASGRWRVAEAIKRPSLLVSG